MKKVLIVLGILLLVAVLALAVFLATFNADRYRPAVAQKMSQAFGHPVQLDRLSLKWRSGIALELDHLRSSTLKVEKVEALLQLMPLLRGSLQLGTVTLIRPEIQAARDPNGAITVEGFTPPQAAPSAPAKAIPLFIRLLEIRDGTLQFTDRTIQPPLSLTFRKADVTLRNVSMTGPVSVEGRLAFLRPDPNVRFSGEVSLTGADGSLALRRFQLQADLTGLGPSAGAEGKIDLKIDRMDFSSRGITGATQLRVEQGRLVGFNLLREALERLTIIPGLAEKLAAGLPESYKEKLNASDTVFQPIELNIGIAGDRLAFDRLRVATDTVELEGTGQARLDGSLALSAQVRIEPQLSQALFQAVEELRFLADARGRVEIPVVVQGRFPQMAVFPDLNVVGQKLFSSQGQELVGTLLQKVLEKNFRNKE